MAFAKNMKRSTLNMGRSSGARGVAERVVSSPATKIIGVGVIGYFAYKLGRRYYDEHPQIREFIRENLETVEDKFREYRETLSDMSH